VIIDAPFILVNKIIKARKKDDRLKVRLPSINDLLLIAFPIDNFPLVAVAVLP